jgi:hypothetical protein
VLCALQSEHTDARHSLAAQGTEREQPLRPIGAHGGVELFFRV